MPDIGAIAATEEIGWTSSTQLLPNGDGGLLIKTNAGSTLLSSDTSGNITPTGAVRVGASDCVLARDAANVLALRNSTNSQKLRVYHTYTDGSNYQRAAINVAAGSVAFVAETAGTGADNIDLTLTPAGTGVVQFGTHAALSGESVTGYITIKDAGGTSRKIAVVS